MDSLVLRDIHPSATLGNGVSAAKRTPVVDLGSLGHAHGGYAGDDLFFRNFLAVRDEMVLPQIVESVCLSRDQKHFV